MDATTLIRRINEAGNQYYNLDGIGGQHREYLLECDNAFRKYLRHQLGDSYLFSTLSFKDRRKGNHVTFANESTRYDYSESVKSVFKPIIEGEGQGDECLLNDLPHRATSITLNLMNTPIGFDLFFEGIEPYKGSIKLQDRGARIHFFSLYKLDYEIDFNLFNKKNGERIEEFLKLESFKSSDVERSARLLWYYKRMQVDYLHNYPDGDFIVHFLRPAHMDFDRGLLLSLATNEIIPEPTLSSINLINRSIVSKMAVEEFKEIERLKRKTSLSLTTHGLKTEVGNTLIKMFEILEEEHRDEVVEQLNCDVLLSSFNGFKELLNQVYALTGILSLVDKFDDADWKSIVRSGVHDNLLSKERQVVDVTTLLDFFNSKKKDDENITIECVGIQLNEIEFKFFDHYFHENMIRLFYLTIFENIIKHGAATKDRGYVLSVDQSEHFYVFSNKMSRKTYETDGKKLRGNLDLFKLLLNVKEERFDYTGKDYVFEVRYKST